MRYLLLLILLLTAPSLSAQKHARAIIDSLNNALPYEKNDTLKTAILDKLSYAYSTVDPQVGIDYGRQTLKLATQQKWTHGRAAAHADLGINYAALSVYDSALHHYHLASQLYDEIKDNNAVGSVAANISLVYLAQSRYPKALEYAFKALEIKEETGDQAAAAVILENIGTIYLERKNHKKTMQYYTRALNMYRALDDREGMARNLGNMGILLDGQGNYQDALRYHTRALEINQELDNRYSMQINHANIGIAWYHLKRYDRALEHQQQALHISQALGGKTSIAVNLGNLGETYLAMAKDTGSKAVTGDVQKAIDYLEKAANLCHEINFSGPLIEFNKYLSEAYTLAGDYRRALAAFQAYDALDDSVFSMVNKTKISELETKRELQLRDKQIQIDQLEVARKNDERIIYIISIALLLLIVGVSTRNIRNYRRSNTVLQEEKIHHLQLIEEQVNHIKKQAGVLEEIAHMQSHDIRGPVATILGLVQLFNHHNLADPVNKVVIGGITRITTELDIAVQEVIQKKNDLARENNRNTEQ